MLEPSAGLPHFVTEVAKQAEHETRLENSKRRCWKVNINRGTTRCKAWSTGKGQPMTWHGFVQCRANLEEWRELLEDAEGVEDEPKSDGEETRTSRG